MNMYQQAKTSYTPRLSARQQSILRCLIQGDSNKTHRTPRWPIAEANREGFMSKAILRKIRSTTARQAAIWAMSTGPFISRQRTTLRLALGEAAGFEAVSPVWMSHKSYLQGTRRTDQHYCRRSNSKERTMSRCRTSCVSSAKGIRGKKKRLICLRHG